jgi:hypothetical protein
MPKKFNITGLCLPAKHYMADISEKLAQVLALVEEGEYFAISRPRQYGKTTMLWTVAAALRQAGRYLVFNISFEGLGSTVFSSEQQFSQAFLELLRDQMSDMGNEPLAAFLEEASRQVETMKDLSRQITALAHQAGQEIVLLIDEVDKSSDNQKFLDFLGVLRNKYLRRHLRTEQTFHSVVLAGVHDVKTLKAKLRADEEAKQNSPWNIAAEFKVVMSLLPHEIVPMLEDYAQERGVNLDAPALAERLYYYTSGYPFLVSALCKIVDEEMLPERADKNWHLGDIDEAARRLIHSIRSNTNFDSLIKNLENHPELYALASDLLLRERALSYNVHNPIIKLGVLYGIFRNGEGLNIHNRVYEQIIYDYLVSKMETSIPAGSHLFRSGIHPDSPALDMEKVLLNFQAFMKSRYSARDRAFLEREGRLVFLAFLRPILNGKGHDFIEAQTSEEKRLDVAVTYNQYQYVVELKVWRGQAAHQRGLAQLADYLDRQGLDEGYLVIFDPRRSVETIHESSRWAQEWIEVEGKRVFAVWV